MFTEVYGGAWCVAVMCARGLMVWQVAVGLPKSEWEGALARFLRRLLAGLLLKVVAAISSWSPRFEMVANGCSCPYH
jgi:hypothetical protein